MLARRSPGNMKIKPLVLSEIHAAGNTGVAGQTLAKDDSGALAVVSRRG
jgi:hypothetical protein